MLKPHQLLAIDAFVVGATEEQAAKAAGVHRSSVARWKKQVEFNIELMNRTREATQEAKRSLGAEIRADVQASLEATTHLRSVLNDPASPPWMRFQAAQSLKKAGRRAAELLDPELRSTEATGKLDRERQQAENELNGRIAMVQHKDRNLRDRQEEEKRWLANRTKEREAELLRRMNVLARLRKKDRVWLMEQYVDQDKQEEYFEAVRREKTRRDYAEAAGIAFKDMPRLRWKFRDLSKWIEKHVRQKAPRTDEEAFAEFSRHEQLGTLGEIRGMGIRVEEGVGSEKRVGSADVPRPPTAPSSSKPQESAPSPSSKNISADQSEQPEEGGRGTPALPTREMKPSTILKRHWQGELSEDDIRSKTA